MIFENFENIGNKDYPVIIFGSGPAGVSLALGLEKKNINSLIIEAGTNNYSEDSQQNYKSKIIGDEINDLKYSRLRQFGGTSGHWGGWCRPIERWNIQNWGETAERGARGAQQPESETRKAKKITRRSLHNFL